MAALKGPRVEPEGEVKRLVVFVHGYGANGDDLIGLAEPLKGVLPDTAFVSPNAPEGVPGMPGAYQWFGLDSVDLSPEGMSWGAREAAPLLDAYLNEELERYGLSDDKLALVGFSQGTMMSLYVGLRRMDAPACILGFSGLLPDHKLEEDLAVKPPVFLIHGEQDDRIPAQASLKAAETLEGLGLSVQTHISPGIPHAIGPDGLQLGARFLVENLSK